MCRTIGKFVPNRRRPGPYLKLMVYTWPPIAASVVRSAEQVWGVPVRRSWFRTVAAAIAVSSGLLAGASTAAAAPGPQTGDPGQYIYVPDQGPVRVNVVSGNLLLTESDLTDSANTYHVTYGRSYNSLATTNGALGQRWNLSVGPDVSLDITASAVTLRSPNGARVSFAVQSDGTLTPPEGYNGFLTHAANGTYVLTQGDNTRLTFDQNGAEVSVTDDQARPFTVQATSAAGKTILGSYGTADGRRINASYNGDSRVRLIDDPASGHHTYGYNNGLLTSYAGPSSTANYAYDSNGHLTTATYSDGRIYTIDPLADGRTHSLTIHVAGTADQTWTFTYGTAQTTVANPDGTTTAYAFDADGNVLEDPTVLQAAAEAYAEEYNTDLATAKTWMTNQDRSAPVGEQIGKTSIQSGYAGLWYDNVTRRIKLNLTTGTATGPARTILERDGVNDLTDIAMVDYTQSQIDARVDTLTTELGSVIQSGHLRLSRDIEHNTVLAELATMTTAAERTQVEAAAAGTGVPVTLQNVDESTFSVDFRACGNRPVFDGDGKGLACTAPLRGGVRIDHVRTTSQGSQIDGACTIGFTARARSSGNPYVITAGHCFAGGDTTDWRLRQPTGADVPLGDAGNIEFGRKGDFGLIHVNDAAMMPLVPIAIFNRDTRLTDGRDAHYEIFRSSYSRRGQFVCGAGATTGAHCGRILRENVPYNGEGRDIEHGAVARVCIGDGDSGGSVIRGRSAVGIMSASYGPTSGSGCRMIFTGAKSAEARLDVSINYPTINTP